MKKIWSFVASAIISVCLFRPMCDAQLIFTKAGGASMVGDYNTATQATLNYTRGVAVDGSGNILIADANNNRVRKVDAATGIITTIAGTGVQGFSGDGGLAPLAQLSNPMGVAIDADGYIYIADRGNQRIRMIAPSTGFIYTIAGTGVPGYAGDGGPATLAQLSSPFGIAIDRNGNIYIAEEGNQRIRCVALSTGAITTVAGNGSIGYSGDGGAATSAMLNSPSGVAVDNDGNIYIADKNNQRIRKVNISTGIITTVAGNGNPGFSGDGGLATSATLLIPEGVAVDDNGNIYIADNTNQRIRKVTVATGIITTVAGNGTMGFSGDGGSATSAQFNFPGGVAVDGTGNIYISDNSNHRIRKVTAATGIISTVAGNGANVYTGDGLQANFAYLNYPGGIAIDGSGNIYSTDFIHQRIRKIDASTGVITSVAGSGIAGFSGDGGSATLAGINGVRGVAVDGNGNVYLADENNQRIRKVNAATGVITTIAGNGTMGYSGDGGPATSAQLNYPEGVAVDADGNVYIADVFNQRIRKVTAANGIITTVAGNGSTGYAGDGGIATAASLTTPQGVAVDAAGNIYIVDLGNHSIRKVTVTTGIMTTVAGNGTGGYSGDNGPAVSAQLYFPQGVAVDADNNIYIGDGGNHRIRTVDAATGIISTIVGTGSAGFSGDGGAAISAQINAPFGVALDANENLYFADVGNYRIRYVCNSVSIVSATSYDSGNVSQNNSYVSAAQCALQSQVEPAGANPVTGTVTDTVWIEPAVPVFQGQPYVQRHYGITPQTNATTATGIVTLYFTQEEFTAYNAAPNHGLSLPVDENDVLNYKANVHIIKRSGTSNNGSGLYETYSGAATVITPNSVDWDADLNAWVVSFDVTGFSGFFASSSLAPLPLTLIDFAVSSMETDALIKWTTENEINTSHFEIEHSFNGQSFSKVGSVAARSNTDTRQIYDFVYPLDKARIHYFRLKMVDGDGSFTYSKVVRLSNKNQKVHQFILSPNPAHSFFKITGGEVAGVMIKDISGRTVKAYTINDRNRGEFSVDNLSPAIYLITIINKNGHSETQKLVVY